VSYYTIAHYLHSDLFGRVRGRGDIGFEQMKDAVWDYIFCRTELTDEVLASGIPKETLESMRREFEFFYPLDLRVSGKDLIPNHLTFFIYCHLALFPREYWPKGIRVNGHLLLNAEKMSKSTGNFMTIQEVVQKYGADATRIAMADAGDTIADSNFEEDVADNTVLTLHTKRDLYQDILKDESQLRTGEFNTFQDALFANEMRVLVHEAKAQYELTNYKLALKSAWYDFASAWSSYKEACAAAGIKMHKDLVREFIELQALTICPIAPHWAEYLYQDILKKPKSIQLATWPDLPAADAGLTAANDFMRSTASSVFSAESAALRKKAKGKETGFDPKKPKKLTIFTTKSFPSWQEKYIELVKYESTSSI
jgi:leucyl-tRNA synthetase